MVAMEKIERTERKLIRKCHVFDLYEDTIRFEDGHEAHWDYLEHHGAAAVVPVLPDGRILLVRQYRNAVDRISLEIPAGKKDSPEEEGLLCAARELEEETGYRAGKMTKLVKLVTAIAYCSETIDLYVAEELSKHEQHLDDDESIDVEAFTEDEILQMITDGTIQDAKTVAAISNYLLRKARGEI